MVFFLARTLTGRLVAAVAAMTMLSLPFTWQLVQGVFFGDATDCSLVGCNALAVATLMYGID